MKSKDRELILFRQALKAWGEVLDESIDALLARDMEKYKQLKRLETKLANEMLTAGDNYFIAKEIKETLL